MHWSDRLEFSLLNKNPRTKKSQMVVEVTEWPCVARPLQRGCYLR